MSANVAAARAQAPERRHRLYPGEWDSKKDLRRNGTVPTESERRGRERRGGERGGEGREETHWLMIFSEPGPGVSGTGQKSFASTLGLQLLYQAIAQTPSTFAPSAEAPPLSPWLFSIPAPIGPIPQMPRPTFDSCLEIPSLHVGGYLLLLSPPIWNERVLSHSLGPGVSAASAARWPGRTWGRPSSAGRRCSWGPETFQTRSV